MKMNKLIITGLMVLSTSAMSADLRQIPLPNRPPNYNRVIPGPLPPRIPENNVYEEQEIVEVQPDIVVNPIPVPRPLPCVNAITTNLNISPYGIEMLAVRDGPDTAYPIIQRLLVNHPVLVCGEVGGWLGILFDPMCPVDRLIDTSNWTLTDCPRGWSYGKYIVNVE
jgi:hypothetical protein